MPTKPETPRLDCLPRSDPIAALRVMYALVGWSERWEWHTTFEEACGDRRPAQLAEELVQHGCPRDALPRLPQDDYADEDAVRRAADRLKSLSAWLSPPGNWCLEVVANLDARDPVALLALAGLRSDPSASDAGCVANYLGHEERVTQEALESLQAAVGIVQEMAAQIASGAEVVKLLDCDAKRVRHLTRLARELRGGPRRREIRLVELQFTPRRAAGRIVLTSAPREEPQEVTSSWFRAVDERADPQFRDNWVVARATAFLVSYCLGLEAGYVKRCGAPRGLLAYLDYLLGERDEAPAACNTFYVTDRSDRVHCGRETCRKTQRIIANEHLLGMEVAKRAEALARRIWDRSPVRGTFTKAWLRAGENLATFKQMIASS